MPGISKRSRGFQGTQPRDLGPLENEDLADLMRERLGIALSREEMQTTFEDFRGFIGSTTDFEAANELLSAPEA